MAYITDLPNQFRRQGTSVNPHVGADSRKVTASDVWYVPMGELTQFLTVVSGTPETIMIGEDISFSRIVPLRFADYPQILAVGFDCEYRGDSRGLSTTYKESWMGGEVTINYETPDFPLDGSLAFARVTEAPSPRLMRVPASATLFDTDSTKMWGDKQVPVAGVVIHIQLYRVLLPSRGLYQSLYNHVNNAVFLDYPPGHVLYQGATIEPEMSNFGFSFTYTITHEFVVSHIPWNYEFRRDGALEELWINGDVMHPGGNLELLFYA